MVYFSYMHSQVEEIKARLPIEEMVGAYPLDPPLERPFSIVFQRQKFRLRAMDEFMDFAHEHCEKRSAQKNSHS